MALNFPNGPSDGDIYEGYVWNATVGAWQTATDSSSLGNIGDVTVTSTSSGDVLVYDGTDWVNRSTYTYQETVAYTSSGTFAKADYPDARLFVARVQAGGGGGGGFPSGTARASSSGGGGGYVIRAFEPASLSASVTVTVGAGGAGSTGNGSAGGQSSFGNLEANGGNFGRDWAGTGMGLPYKENEVGGGSSSSDFDYLFGGGFGGGYFQWGTANCSKSVVAGQAGKGGHVFAGPRNFAYDFVNAITDGPLGRTFFPGNSSGYFNNNSGASPSTMAARNTNSGGGGSGRGIECTGNQVGYGGGGDSGFVEVDIYV